MAQELKAIKVELNNHGKPIASIQGTTSYYGISPNDTFYRQEDTDRYIDLIKDKLKHKSEEYSNTCRFYENELRRHKYKRCLYKAKLCQWKMGVFIYHKEKNEFYYRWHKRWLELAEKFKEA